MAPKTELNQLHRTHSFLMGEFEFSYINKDFCKLNFIDHVASPNDINIAETKLLLSSSFNDALRLQIEESARSALYFKNQAKIRRKLDTYYNKVNDALEKCSVSSQQVKLSVFLPFLGFGLLGLGIGFWTLVFGLQVKVSE